EGIFAAGDNGSTFGGNPVSCAGALNILSRLDEKTLTGVQKRSKMIVDALTGAEGIVGVSGMGLMLGVETVKPAGDVIAACREAGVLVIKAKNKVRLLPPLNIPEDLLARALDILCAACR
ncbi:MAG: aminotransferase class III-fold pyridoxal phosphate-dependent enzyme, partial [Ruminococcaceae bacterium]|nr:aminotransferase class III-fold pyridoxal phosphate-dependent enzyme [Oscillospiraceae bacterium]